jgi:radical S-adenosyl methionine domain-containing protein 2
MEKINFSGGEPFIHKKGEFLGELVRYCKVDLRLPSVTVVSNGSLITEEWFQKYGEHLDILAISCDSFSEATNMEIGRRQGSSNHLSSLLPIRDWCQEYKVAFKINSVINTHNWQEDMVQEIQELDPVRWKVREWGCFWASHHVPHGWISHLGIRSKRAFVLCFV